MNRPDLTARLRSLAVQLDHAATQDAIVRSHGIMPSSRPEDDERDHEAADSLRAAADRIEALEAQRAELGEQIVYLRHNCMNLSRDELIQRITAVGAAEWEAGAWIFEREDQSRSRIEALEAENERLNHVTEGSRKLLAASEADVARLTEGIHGTPEDIARRFHEAYERLAPEHGYETREVSAVPWEEVPDRNRALMVATVRALIEGDDDGQT